MNPSHFGPNGPRPHATRPAASSRHAAVTEATAQVERLLRLTMAMERLCTEILVRLDWLEADVAELKREAP